MIYYTILFRVSSTCVGPLGVTAPVCFVVIIKVLVILSAVSKATGPFSRDNRSSCLRYSAQNFREHHQYIKYCHKNIYLQFCSSYQCYDAGSDDRLLARVNGSVYHENNQARQKQTQHKQRMITEDVSGDDSCISPWSRWVYEWRSRAPDCWLTAGYRVRG